jgi:hypothetical protein
MNNLQVWKEIIEYPNYEVSSHGNLVSNLE